MRGVHSKFQAGHRLGRPGPAAIHPGSHAYTESVYPGHARRAAGSGHGGAGKPFGGRAASGGSSDPVGGRAMAGPVGADGRPTIDARRAGRAQRDRPVVDWQCAGSGDYGIDFPCELFLRLGTNNPLDHLSILEDHERGDRHDPVLDRELLVVIGVEFADLQAAGVLGGQFLDDWRHHLAGAAPGGPKIDEHGHVGINDLSGKITLVEFDFVRHFALLLAGSRNLRITGRAGEHFFVMNTIGANAPYI